MVPGKGITGEEELKTGNAHPVETTWHIAHCATLSQVPNPLRNRHTSQTESDLFYY